MTAEFVFLDAITCSPAPSASWKSPSSANALDE
jgi:hypothetical protein